MLYCIIFIEGMGMKKYLFLGLAIILSFGQCFAVEAVSPELQESLKVTTSEPNLLSIIFALLVVIFLIYITGFIYTKLNIAGARVVKEQLKNYDLSKVIVISTTQLGQNKNLHVIEINNQRLLISATPESINLIKELGPIKLGEKVEKTVEAGIDDPISVLYNGNNTLEDAQNLKDLKEDLLEAQKEILNQQQEKEPQGKELQREEKLVQQRENYKKQKWNQSRVREKEFTLHKKYL